MIVATYIIFSYILSAVGYGIYHFFVRRHVSAKQQKMVLYTVLGLSLLLPLAFLQSNPLFYTEKPHNQVELHDEPVLTKELLACYARTKKQHDKSHALECEKKTTDQSKQK